MGCHAAPLQSEMSPEHTVALMEEIDYRCRVMDVFVDVQIVGCNICHHCICSYERHQSQPCKSVGCLFQDREE